MRIIKFFKCFFLKELKQKYSSTNNNENKVSYINKKDPNLKKDIIRNSKEIFEKIKDDIASLRKEMNGMIVTDQSGISDKISSNTNKVKTREIFTRNN